MPPKKPATAPDDTTKPIDPPAADKPIDPPPAPIEVAPVVEVDAPRPPPDPVDPYGNLEHDNHEIRAAAIAKHDADEDRRLAATRKRLREQESEALADHARAKATAARRAATKREELQRRFADGLRGLTDLFKRRHENPHEFATLLMLAIRTTWAACTAYLGEPPADLHVGFAFVDALGPNVIDAFGYDSAWNFGVESDAGIAIAVSRLVKAALKGPAVAVEDAVRKLEIAVGERTDSSPDQHGRARAELWRSAATANVMTERVRAFDKEGERQRDAASTYKAPANVFRVGPPAARDANAPLSFEPLRGP